jgi:hypothetical protein
MLPQYRKRRCPCPLPWEGKFRVWLSWGGRLRWATFWSELHLSLKFRRFRLWRTSSSSALLRVLALSRAFNSCISDIQGTKNCLSTESLAVARSVFFRNIYNGSPFRAFPYRGWCVSRQVLNVAQQLKELFQLSVRVGILLPFAYFWPRIFLRRNLFT